MNEHQANLIPAADDLTLFQSMIETAETAMFVYQQDRFVYVNAAAERFSGYSKDEFLAMDHWQPLHPKDQAAARNRGQALLAGEQESDSVETRFVKKNGSILWVDYATRRIEYRGHPAVAGVVTSIESMQSRNEMWYACFENNHTANMFLQDGHIIDCNQETLNLFGSDDKTQFCQLHPGELSPIYQPDGMDSMQAANTHIAMAIEQGFKCFEWVHQRLDGTTFDAEILLTAVSLDNVQSIHATVIHISSRKQVERHLQHRLHIEQAISSASHLLLSTKETDLNQVLQVLGEAVQVDRAYIFEFRAENFNSMDNTYEWCAADVEAQIDSLQGLSTALFPWWMHQLQAHKIINTPCVNNLPIEADAEKDILQEQKIQAVLVVPLTTSEGELVGFIGFDDVQQPRKWDEHDIRSLQISAEMISATIERRAIMQELRTSKKNILKAQALVHIGTWEFTADHTRMSKEIFNIFGHPYIANPSFKVFLKLVCREDRPVVKQAIQQAVAEGSFNNAQCRIVLSNGEIRHVLAHGECFTNQQTGQILRIFGTIQDISERVKLEKAQAESKAKSDFLAVMSHELRTPLHGIIGLQDLLVSELQDLPSKQKERLALAQHSAHILSSLIDDILDLSKIESGSMELSEGECDLPLLLHNSILTFLARAQQKNIGLELEMIAVPRKVYVDETRIRQILLNIVGNAMKFTKQGKVRITASYECLNTNMHGQLNIRIYDSGIGMTADELTQLFEPFKQLGQRITREGTGLGTTIAMKFARMMGGGIAVESTPDQGSMFHITFLLKALSEERVNQQTDLKAVTVISDEVEMNKTSVHNLKYLLAEDDPVARFLAMENMQKLGLDVDVAENGLIAWERLQHKVYDVLLTDIRMPGLDGIELTQKIRQVEKEKNDGRRIKIIGLSAHAMSHVAEEAYASGMDSFISKPVDLNVLMQYLLKVKA